MNVLWLDDSRFVEVAPATTTAPVQECDVSATPLSLRLALRLARHLERFAIWLSVAMYENPLRTRAIVSALFVVFAALSYAHGAQAAGNCSATAGVLNTINNDLCTQGQNFFTASIPIGDAIFAAVATISIGTTFVAYFFEFKSLSGALQKIVSVLFVIAIPWAILKFAETVLPGWFNVALALGNTITGENISPNPDSIFVTGAGLAGQMMASVANVLLHDATQHNLNIGMALVDVVSAVVAILGALILLITFTLLAIEMLVAFCQGYIALSIGVFQLGWSASSATSNLATAYWGLVSSAITRIIVTMSIIGIALTEAQRWIRQIQQMQVLDPANTKSGPDLLTLLQIPLLGIALLFLVVKVTEFASAQLTGRPVYSAGAAGAVGAGRAVGGAAGAMGGAIGGGMTGGVAGAVRGAASGGSIESAISGGLAGAMGGAARAGRAGGKAGASAGSRAGSSVRRS